MLQQVENNTAAKSILNMMIDRYALLKNQNAVGEIQYIPQVNYTTIRQAWIEKHNTLRSELWLSNLQNNDQLNKTAQIRANHLAETMAPTGTTHQRSSSDAYYDYDKILQWFGEQGVVFNETNTIAFSENIGYGYYRWCKDVDCTDKLLNQTRSTRDFFVGEASRNGPHYRAMTQAHFTQMGIGVGRNTSTKRYYIVVHYGVETK